MNPLGMGLPPSRELDPECRLGTAAQALSNARSAAGCGTFISRCSIMSAAGAAQGGKTRVKTQPVLGKPTGFIPEESRVEVLPGCATAPAGVPAATRTEALPLQTQACPATFPSVKQAKQRIQLFFPST